MQFLRSVCYNSFQVPHCLIRFFTNRPKSVILFYSEVFFLNLLSRNFLYLNYTRSSFVFNLSRLSMQIFHALKDLVPGSKSGIFLSFPVPCIFPVPAEKNLLSASSEYKTFGLHPGQPADTAIKMSFKYSYTPFRIKNGEAC